MSTRRSVLTYALAAALAPARAQAPPVVAWISGNRRAALEPGFEKVIAQLARLGDVRGRDFSFVSRYAENQPAQVPVLVREVIALRPAVIVAHANLVATTVVSETKTIPVVVMNSVSPVAIGLVSSLPRPGGNVTGTTYNPLEIGGKMVEALYSVAPRAVRVTLIWNPTSQAGAMRLYKPFVDRAAERLQRTYTYFDVLSPGDFTEGAVLATRPDAIMVATDPVVTSVMPRIIRFATEHKLPTLSVVRNFVEDGGLVTLQPDEDETVQNVADLVHRVLHGARPGDLAIREPSRFNLLLNMKTAKAIGLTVPREALLQASEVIE